MPVERLTDLADARLEPFRNLKATNATRRQDRLIAEGDKLVERVIQAGLPVDSLMVTERLLLRFQPLLPPESQILVVPNEAVNEIVGFRFHRGVLAWARRPPQADLLALTSAPGPVTLLACPETHDPQNLGAILRMAAAFGVTAVALGPDCCDPYMRRVLRVSMGTALGLPIRRCPNLREELTQLRNAAGIELWATVTAPDALRFDRTPRPEKLALILGSEGHGLSDAWQQTADRRITIPMHRGTDSLNVAGAAGILLYHLAGEGNLS